MKKTTQAFNLSDPIHFFALGFGSGLAPKAPGTFGTLVAIPLFLLASVLTASHYFLLVCFMSVVGVYFCGKAASDVNVPDHSAIVWDEIVGFMITMFMMPVSWQAILVGFVLFRLFDILKPWPISFIDKHCHGGLGIMLDDIVAGIAAWFCLYLIFLIYPEFRLI